MSVSEVINTIASIVSIVGGLLGIWSALRTQSRRLAPTAQPSPLPPAPPYPFPTDAPRLPEVRPWGGSALKPSRWANLVYGLLAGVPAAILLSASDFTYREFGDSMTLFSLSIAALAVLSIYAGFQASLRDGSMWSSVLTGAVVAITASLGTTFYAVLRDRRAGEVLLYLSTLLILFGLPILVLSILSGVVGRKVYMRSSRPVVPMIAR